VPVVAPWNTLAPLLVAVPAGATPLAALVTPLTHRNGPPS
jgi:hypothetical protein